ncbi:hypothetical protein EUX98_g6740 [Antrodiella citrinella]|uniref:Epoxide hydrolase N-terminal domain-containing protein n=1 Tax=Antrodiella citrinella TaxID=2447956 RepID=A0A4S4MQT2_9APHY|nr:hypothetical protein EUX98_g6740 [Antrodiella citrinella]
MSNTEKPFKVSVFADDLELLRRKLDLTRLPDELDEAGWDYGSPLADIRRLLARWRDGFDWKVAEDRINLLPQFTRDIEVDGFGTLNIHYVHQKSAADDAIPLIFIHGWPGHFLEVTKILPLLTSSSGKYPSFHVVALSLPGYGFSEGPKKKRFAISKYAEVSHKLMIALGYEQYVVQGGDWGYVVGRNMAHMYGPEHVKAWHTNFPICGPPSFTHNPFLFLKMVFLPFLSKDMAGLKKTAKWQKTGQGYGSIQQQRPQTLGYSMMDSPVGLLAWIYDKLVDWTDDYKWTDDETAARIYYEFEHVGGLPGYSPVPFGQSYFPKELIHLPKWWAPSVGKVVFQAEHTSGGHFAAYEKPDELVADLRTMFGRTPGFTHKHK